MESGVNHTLHPGPIDNSVLNLQDYHRSSDIWNGQSFEPLTCRRCDGQFWRLGTLDPRVQKMMLKAGFYGVYKAGRMRLDHALVTALVERWRPETHTFHLPVGEATVTLQDISLLWGLPVDGEPITGVDTNHSMDEWQEICQELLGFRPPPEDFDRGRLKIRCLQERFKILPDNATEEIVQFYARAYILQLLGGQLLSDMSNNKVKLMYLPLLRDFEAAGRLSWGGAVLACLYRALCRATKPETSDICGPLVLLQIWAWERIPFIRPGKLVPQQQPPPDVTEGDLPLPTAPYGSRWNVGFKLENVGTHVLVLYRDQLDNMKDDQFIWEPYPAEVLASLPEYCLSGRRIWQTVSPLICFDVIEFHHPDRVLRQFGQHQTIPAACDTIPDIHLTDRRGRQNYDWAHHHRQFVDMWDSRFARIVTTPPIDGPMDQTDSYMVWYRQITRSLIGNPVSRPHTGYHSGGAAMDTMQAQTLQKIYHCARDAIQEGYDVARENALREIQEICEYSLRAFHEDHRLNPCPDSKPLVTVTPFVPPKATRGRPRKRGAISGVGRGNESQRRGGSYVPKVVLSGSSDMSHSFKPSEILPSCTTELSDTAAHTWDSLLTADEFPDIKDPNTMMSDPEAPGTSNPVLQTLGKIRDLCVSTLRLSNGNQAMISTNDSAGDGHKLKRCTPRRRRGLSGYSADANSGVNSYFPSPSASLGPNDSSAASPHCILEQDVEPLVMPLPELQDNMQLEMIELDTITGSREPSPCHSNLSLPNHLSCDLSEGIQDPLLSFTAAETCSQIITIDEQNNEDVKLPLSVLEEPIDREQGLQIPVQPYNGITPSSVHGDDISVSQVSKPESTEFQDLHGVENHTSVDTIKIEGPDLDTVEADRGKRKEIDADTTALVSTRSCSESFPDETNNNKNQTEAAATEDFPIMYKRQRRSVPKTR